MPLERQLLLEQLSLLLRVVSELLCYPCILESLVEPINNRRLLEASLCDPQNIASASPSCPGQ